MLMRRRMSSLFVHYELSPRSTDCAQRSSVKTASVLPAPTCRACGPDRGTSSGRNDREAAEIGKPLQSLSDNWNSLPLQNVNGREKGLVRKGGLEPPRVAPPDPKSGASANSATFALRPLQSRCEARLVATLLGRTSEEPKATRLSPIVFRFSRNTSVRST
jgi:hypothetical protein